MTKMSTRKGNTIKAEDLILVGRGKVILEMADENTRNHMYKMVAVMVDKIVEATKRGEKSVSYEFGDYWE